MKGKISLLTLGVGNLAESIRFYEALGFSRVAFESEGVAFYQLEGTWLSLYPREALAEDAGVSSIGGGFNGFSMAHNVAERDDVDRVLDEAVAIGAVLVKPAADVFWGGRSGYFSDPDGFLWEVAWNPFMDLT